MLPKLENAWTLKNLTEFFFLKQCNEKKVRIVSLDQVFFEHTPFFCYYVSVFKAWLLAHGLHSPPPLAACFSIALFNPVFV